MRERLSQPDRLNEQVAHTETSGTIVAVLNPSTFSFSTPKGNKFTQEYEVYSQRFQREDLDEDARFDPQLLPKEYLTNPKPALEQAKRYARGVFAAADEWNGFRVPFLYASWHSKKSLNETRSQFGRGFLL